MRLLGMMSHHHPHPHHKTHERICCCLVLQVTLKEAIDASLGKLRM